MSYSSSSDEQTHRPATNDVYYRKLKALQRICREIDQENNDLCKRMADVADYLRHARQDCLLIRDKLDELGDDYRSAAKQKKYSRVISNTD